MTDQEKLADLAERLALLVAERKMLKVQAADENNGVLGFAREYAKLRLKRIDKEEKALQEEHEQVSRYVEWERRTRP
jgi:hypothetical protein